MPRNIEIKARIASVEALLPLAQSLSDGPAQAIAQDDAFFAWANGRLKLRDFDDGHGELIHYQRADSAAAKLSDYVRVPTDDPAALREALTRAHGAIGGVRKLRWLLLPGAMRIHLDRVESTGDFVELDELLRDGQTEADGVAIADRLLQRLGVAPEHQVAGAYLDLLPSLDERR